MSDYLQKEIAFLGTQDRRRSSARPRNGCAERFIRALEGDVLWGIEDQRRAC